MKHSTKSNTAGTIPTEKTSSKKNSTNTSDLQDSPRDLEKMQGDEATLDLPEVKDIPGQEYIHVPRMRQFADTTASSADEEGAGLLDDLNDPKDDKVTDDEADVSPEEAALLQDAADFSPTEEEERLRETALDSTDEDGEPLNEKGFSNSFSGNDLDVPGSEEDDDDEALGEEDEENNSYSVDRNNEADDEYDGK